MTRQKPMHVAGLAAALWAGVAASIIAGQRAAPAGQAVTTDYSGEWAVVRSQDNTENPWVGDFLGLPLNADGLARAETWDASLLSLPEYQCRPHGWAYIYRGPTALRISKDVDPYSRELVAYQPEWHQSTNMPVFLDGREHPPADSAHSWGGYSTATWEGDILRIETSHLKEDYIRRDGAMATDEATVTTWWIRRGDILTWVNIIHDPSYLSEPLIRSSEYRLNVNGLVPPHPCTSVFEGLEKGHVPHFQPGDNPFLKDIRSRYGLAAGVPTGGVETMYPEYQQKVQDSAWSRGDAPALIGR
jgi:hypothetical protein